MSLLSTKIKGEKKNAKTSFNMTSNCHLIALERLTFLLISYIINETKKITKSKKQASNEQS
jgi:hypothetical protein